MQKINFGCLVILAILLFTCKSRLQRISEDGELIAKAKYGRAWPFKADSLWLFSGAEKEIDIYVERKGSIYALNSKASDMTDSEEVDAFRPWAILVKNPDSIQWQTFQLIQQLASEQRLSKSLKRD